MVILAAPSALAGFWGIEHFLGKTFPAGEAVHDFAWYDQLLAPFNHSPLAALFGLLAVMVGASFAFKLYWNALKDPLPEMLGTLSRAMRNRFYFDEIYEWIIARTQDALAEIADFFDRWFIAGLMVRGTHGATELFGRALRLAQNGNLQTYTFLFVAGVALLLYFVLLR